MLKQLFCDYCEVSTICLDLSSLNFAEFQAAPEVSLETIAEDTRPINEEKERLAAEETVTDNGQGDGDTQG